MRSFFFVFSFEKEAYLKPISGTRQLQNGGGGGASGVPPPPGVDGVLERTICRAAKTAIMSENQASPLG